ncbi:hypothetical protein AB0K43_04280 [Kitasatospora sp. NPDC049258]|uniref:hypothetical protein n=1 Tax=Kitasatospora sp. NPDC049258 TaxID=3155394 RepID=UPI003418A8C6
MPASQPIPPHPGANGPDAASDNTGRPAPRRARPHPGPDDGVGGRPALGLLVLALDVWLAGLAALFLLLSRAGHPFPWVAYPASGEPVVHRSHSGRAPLLIAAATAAVLASSALVLALHRRRGAAAVQAVLLAGVLAATLAR